MANKLTSNLKTETGVVGLASEKLDIKEEPVVIKDDGNFRFALGTYRGETYLEIKPADSDISLGLFKMGDDNTIRELIAQLSKFLASRTL